MGHEGICVGKRDGFPTDRPFHSAESNSSDPGALTLAVTSVASVSRRARHHPFGVSAAFAVQWAPASVWRAQDAASKASVLRQTGVWIGFIVNSSAAGERRRQSTH